MADWKANKLNAYAEAHLEDPRNQVVFINAETGVKAVEYANAPTRGANFYVVHPRNGTRSYFDKKSAVAAAKAMVKRWDNESRFWEREYNL